MTQSTQCTSKGLTELDVVVRTVLKAVYSNGQEVPSQLQIRCCLELLRLDDGTAFRVAYASLQHLAATLRNVCVGPSTSAERLIFRKPLSWPFVRALYLLTEAIGTL